MSALTESKETSLQMLISGHALVRHHSLDTRLLGEDGDLSTASSADMPGT